MPIPQRQDHARDFPGLDGFLHPDRDILLPVHALKFLYALWRRPVALPLGAGSCLLCPVLYQGDRRK
jgi:hypothetical protein